MPNSWKFCAAALALSAIFFAGCGRPRVFTRKPAPPPGEHLTVAAKDTAGLSEREYLMRKATVGSRSERLEALDVIERSRDAELFPFLLERLGKEDDRFLKIRVMQALASFQDVRAVGPIRAQARQEADRRVSIEAVVSLYELGDDNYVPTLIRLLRLGEDFPELAGIAHRTLKKIYEQELPASPRVWNNYYRSHRLAPYQQLKWYAAFRPPEPPTIAGTTKVVPRPKGGPQLPQEDVRLRRHIVTMYDFWRPDEP